MRWGLRECVLRSAGMKILVRFELYHLGHPMEAIINGDWETKGELL